MSQDYLAIRKIYQPHTRHILEVCTSDSEEKLKEFTAAFSEACTIVDAQFYYTNPLLFVFVEPEDCVDYTCLFDKCFLIPPRFYDTIEIDVECLAVNAAFVKNVGSLSYVSQNAPRLKQPKDEFGNSESQDHNTIFDSLFRVYQEKGLYVIGVKDVEPQA